MKIDTNTPVAALCDRLREIIVGDCLLSDDKLFLAQAADRLELLEVRWDRIKRLIEVGDAMAYYADQIDIERWRKAKEAKP